MSRDSQLFRVPPNISGMGKAMNVELVNKTLSINPRFARLFCKHLMLRGGWNPTPSVISARHVKSKTDGTQFDSAFKPLSNCVSHDVRFCTESS